MVAFEESSERGLVVLEHEHAVTLHGIDLDLTAREFEIVSKLAEHPGWVFSADQLAAPDQIHDYSPESVSVLVSRLRRKLTQAGAPGAIETVRGLGYRLSGSVYEPGERAAHDETTEMSLLEATWGLQEAVLEAERYGDDACRRCAIDVLENARRAIQDSLPK